MGGTRKKRKSMVQSRLQPQRISMDILGPCLFILYTEDKVEEHDVNFHAFADDTELYVHSRRDQMLPTIQRLERCIDEIGHWMSANRLQLNTAKTELLRIGLKHSNIVSHYQGWKMAPKKT